MVPRMIVGGGRGRFALPELGGRGGEEEEGAEGKRKGRKGRRQVSGLSPPPLPRRAASRFAKIKHKRNEILSQNIASRTEFLQLPAVCLCFENGLTNL